MGKYITYRLFDDWSFDHLLLNVFFVTHFMVLDNLWLKPVVKSDNERVFRSFYNSGHALLWGCSLKFDRSKSFTPCLTIALSWCPKEHQITRSMHNCKRHFINSRQLEVFFKLCFVTIAKFSMYQAVYIKDLSSQRDLLFELIDSILGIKDAQDLIFLVKVVESLDKLVFCQDACCLDCLAQPPWYRIIRLHEAVSVQS